MKDIPIMKNDWFAKDYIRMRDKWIALHGYQQLCEDAGRAGVSNIEFPEVVEPKYRCKLCNAPMVERSGPYGKFLACPKGTREEKHPTQKMSADYEMTVASVRIERFHPAYAQESLMDQIDRQMMQLGGGGMRMSGTERMMVDGNIDEVIHRLHNGTGDAYDEAHWINTGHF